MRVESTQDIILCSIGLREKSFWIQECGKQSLNQLILFPLIYIPALIVWDQTSILKPKLHSGEQKKKLLA
jgi:hypothetical protein